MREPEIAGDHTRCDFRATRRSLLLIPPILLDAPPPGIPTASNPARLCEYCVNGGGFYHTYRTVGNTHRCRKLRG